MAPAVGVGEVIQSDGWGKQFVVRKICETGEFLTRRGRLEQ